MICFALSRVNRDVVSKKRFHLTPNRSNCAKVVFNCLLMLSPYNSIVASVNASSLLSIAEIKNRKEYLSVTTQEENRNLDIPIDNIF